MLPRAAAIDVADEAQRASRPPTSAVPAPSAIVIGRNEGERLRRCLESLVGKAATIVYVDSGSRDGSVEAATTLGAEVVRLDPSRPFTAARARNAGFERLRAIDDRAASVFFVDGDCEVVPGWIDTAEAFLREHPRVAVVCGRRRERFPERSIYNRLCDDEWDTPVGEALACGGDALIRRTAFEEAGGYRDSLIAGEEPELCVRLRERGWKVWRIDAEMTLHDAAMLRFRQWWRRTERAGYAFAEGASLHGAAPMRHWVREARSPWIWAAALPLAIVAGVVAFGPIAAWAAAIYPLQILRVARRGTGSARHRLARAGFLVLGKFAELRGQLRFRASQWSRRQSPIIEYK